MGERRVDPLFGPDGTAGPSDPVDGLLPGFELPQLDLPVIGADGRVTGLAGGDVDPDVDSAAVESADPDPASLPAAGTVAWLVAQRAAAGTPLQTPRSEAPARPGPGEDPATPVASTTDQAVTVPPREPSSPDPSHGEASSPGVRRDKSSGSDRRGRKAASAEPPPGGRSGGGLLRRAPRVDPAAAEGAEGSRPIGSSTPERASSGSSTSESVASRGRARSRGRKSGAEKPTGKPPRDRPGPSEAGPSEADASRTEVPVESPRPVIRPVVDQGPTLRGHRPPIEPEPSILGLSRHTRGKLGSRLFTWFFVAVFVAIAVQLIVSLLTY